jgi:hypothetical protein
MLNSVVLAGHIAEKVGCDERKTISDVSRDFNVPRERMLFQEQVSDRKNSALCPFRARN